MFKLRKERIGEQKIDSGSFGLVFPYQRDPEDLKWVVKRIHANDTDEVLKSFPEIVLGFSCDHPCIVPLKGYHIEKGPAKDYYVYLKFPRMKESLQDRFEEQESTGNRFSEQEIVEYFYSLVCAVDYLHAKKIYHRDIKPDNILLDHQGKAQLCDIGLAKYVGEDETYQKLSGKDGTLFYTAPEILKEREKLTKDSLRANDVWSLGLVMLELCLLEKRPFSPYAAQKKILKVQKKLKGKMKSRYAEKLIDLIFGLLKLNPNERMKITDVKKILEKEYSYCKSFEVDSENDDDEYNRLKENKRRLEEKCKNKTQEMMILLGRLKQENLKLQNELKEYQYSAKKLQFQIISEVSNHYNETIEELKVEKIFLIDETVQKRQELEKKKRLEEKCKSKTQEMIALVGSLKKENLKLRNDLEEYQSSSKELQFQTISEVSNHYNDTIQKLEVKNESLVSEVVQKTQELEKKKRLEEKYQEAAQEMMVFVEALKQENLKLQNELKQYQFSVKKLQFQISDMSKHFYETFKRLEAKNASLVYEIVQKKTQELEKIAQVPPKIEINSTVSVTGLNVSEKSAFCTRLMGRSRENDDFKLKFTTQGGTVFDIFLREIDCEGFKEICPEVLISLYDITNHNSFLFLQLHMITYIRPKRPIVFIIGTKLDLESQRQVNKLEVQAYAEEIKGIHFEVSSKTGENILEFQQELTKVLWQRIGLLKR